MLLSEGTTELLLPAFCVRLVRRGDPRNLYAPEHIVLKQFGMNALRGGAANSAEVVAENSGAEAPCVPILQNSARCAVAALNVAQCIHGSDLAAVREVRDGEIGNWNPLFKVCLHTRC